MRRLFTVVAFLLIGCWAPMTAHCNLERLPAFEFLKCAQDAEPVGDCDDTACDSVESGFYKTQEHPELNLSPALEVVCFALFLDEPDSASGPALECARIVSPPDLPVTWQFVFRTALPPRTPSIAS